MVIAPTVQIASLGMADTFILMVMALVVFGPRRLPQIGRQIGKLMYEFRKASNDFKFQMEEELRNAEEADRRKKEEERLRALALAAPAPVALPAATPTEPLPVTGTAASDTPPAESPNPAAGYDNGPIAISQIAVEQMVDTAPTIMPPSIGETVAAARGWSLMHERARLAKAASAAEQPTIAAPEPGAETKPASPESASSESGSSESAPQATTPAASIAVNQNG